MALAHVDDQSHSTEVSVCPFTGRWVGVQVDLNSCGIAAR
jgi:hypothetical protein